MNPPAPPALQDRLDALRRAGAPHADPIRWRYIEVLAARLPGQPEAVQKRLEDSLQAALEGCAERLGRAAAAPPPARRAACAPLAQLNQLLRNRGEAAAPPGAAANAHAPIRVRDELPSVGRFRRAWTSTRALAQVEQAAANLPANAGPLNSHALVLQTLALMQELSPAYLARFVVQVESLQWLERAAALQPATGTARTTKAAKTAKTAKAPRRAAAGDQPPAGASESRRRK